MPNLSGLSGLGIEGVLSAHQSLTIYGRNNLFACSCGAEQRFTEADHRAHVAAVLREQIDDAVSVLIAAHVPVERINRHSYVCNCGCQETPEAACSCGLRDCPVIAYRAAHLSDTERES